MYHDLSRWNKALLLIEFTRSQVWLGFSKMLKKKKKAHFQKLQILTWKVLSDMIFGPSVPNIQKSIAIYCKPNPTHNHKWVRWSGKC